MYSIEARTASAAPPTLCNNVNTSYTDPPKMRLIQAMNHEFHCGTEPLQHGSRSRAVS
jgi:hypothetical protein